jgi:predicted metallo-beta-lactamase superfamily hydrolase
MINRINLQRAIDNMVAIIKKIKAELIIYDHHLLRDHLYKERMSEVYKKAEKNKKQVITAAEWLGKEPLILKLAKNKPEKSK